MTETDVVSMTISTTRTSVEDALFWLLDQLKERGFDREALSLTVLSTFASVPTEYEVTISGRISPGM